MSLSFDLPTIYDTFKLDLKWWQSKKTWFDVNLTIEMPLAKCALEYSNLSSTKLPIDIKPFIDPLSHRWALYPPTNQWAAYFLLQKYVKASALVMVELITTNHQWMVATLCLLQLHSSAMLDTTYKDHNQVFVRKKDLQ